MSGLFNPHGTVPKSERSSPNRLEQAVQWEATRSHLVPDGASNTHVLMRLLIGIGPHSGTTRKFAGKIAKQPVAMNQTRPYSYVPAQL